ncbi:MAG: hypothetical protein RL196_1333 [Actinomycetota bacterium]|jgi:uncharacterized membrane protein YhaH (DUF805 family)
MTFAGAIKSVFTRWKDYRGVSDRREYWYFTLFAALVGMVCGTIDSLISGNQNSATILTLSNLVQFALLFWVIPMTIRRFHDAGFSGYWFLLGLVPIIVAVIQSRAILLFIDTFKVYATIAEPTKAQDLMLLDRFGSAFGVVLATAIPINIFLFVVTLLKTKPSWRGNRFAPVTQPPVDGWA